jgi:putative ABC transport system permease protein
VSLLVLVLLAAYRGATSGVAAYVGQEGFDLWVAPRGIDNLVRSAGQLPVGAEETVRAIPGVAEVGPILRTFATVEGGPAGDRRRLTLLAIGYRGPAGLGGPPFLVTGRAPASPDEISLDRAAAHRLGAAPGALVDVAGDAARVVGITRGTNLLATQFAFVDLRAAEDALGAFGRPSFLVVRLASGAAPGTIKRIIEDRVPRSAAFPSDEFVRNNVREIAAGVLPVLALVTLLGFGVAVALVALLAQGLADDRRRDAAVLLALGASPLPVGLGVLAHVEKIVVLGAAAGAAAAWAAAAGIEHLAPTVELTIRTTDLLAAPAAFSVAAALAALGAVLSLGRVDPVEAFRP